MAVLFWLLAVFTVVLAVIGPKRYYWAVQAPFRRDPAATEPSDLGYGVGTAANWIAAGVMVLIAIAFTAREAHVYSADEVRSAVDSAASEIDSDPQAGGAFYDVDGAITRQAPGKLRVTDLPHDEAQDTTDDTGYGDGGLGDSDYTVTERYQITNRKGQHPVCLTVTAEQSFADFGDGHGADTEVTDGTCPTA